MKSLDDVADKMSFGSVRLNADSLRMLFLAIIAGVVISSMSVVLLVMTEPKYVRIAAVEYRDVSQQFYGSVEWVQAVLDRNNIDHEQKPSKIQKKPQQRQEIRLEKPRILCWVMTQPKNHQAKYEFLCKHELS